MQIEVEQKKDGSPESAKSSKEKDEKKGKTSKHSKINTQNADAGKDDYIHVRAKRGQATNSHSLAERVCALFLHFSSSVYICFNCL